MKRGKKDSKIGEFAVRLCLLLTSEGTLKKSHQRDCLNMSGVWAAAIDTPQCTGRAPEASAVHKEPQALRNAESGEMVLPKEELTSCLFNNNGYCPQNIHMSNIT